MRAVRVVLLLVAAAAVSAALPGQADAVNFPAASCNGGDCGGWFKSSVTVSWSYDPGGTPSGCGSTTVSDDTSGATFTCTVNYGGSFVGNSVTVRRTRRRPG